MAVARPVAIRATVVRLDADGRPWIEARELGEGYAFGPCDSITRQALTVGDRVLVLVAGTSRSDVVVVGEIGGTASEFDLGASLEALSALTPAADRLPYFTGASSAALTTLTGYARSLLDDADASSARLTLGLGDAATRNVGTAAGTVAAGDHLHTGVYQPAGSYQPLDAELTALAGLASAADRLPYFTGAGAASLATFTGYARTLLDDADSAAARGTLGLGNVDNTSDAAKPVSTAQQAALDLKQTALFDNGLANTSKILRKSGVASFALGTANNVGILMLDTNIGFDATSFFQVHLRGYQYSANETQVDLWVNGQATTAPGVAVTDAYNNGSGKVTGVTLYQKVSTGKLSIGVTVSDDWDHTKIIVDAMLAHSGAEAADFNGWAAALVADATGYTSLGTPTVRKAMRGSDNLANLTNLATARTNLGLGGAAVLNVGTAAGTVAAGDHTHAALYQPLDAELTALAGLASAADRLPYFTGAGAAALATFTAFGRSLVDDADAAAGRATLGLGGAAVLNVGTAAGTVAAGDHSHTLGGLSDVEDGAASPNQYLRWDGTTSTWRPTTITYSHVSGLGGAATLNVGTAAGTVAAGDHTHASLYQPLDSELTALAGLTSAADRLPYFTGAGTAGLATFTAYARTLLDDADAAAARTTLGLGTAAVLNAPASGDAAAGEVVKGSDSRLTDARTPTVHTHALSGLSDVDFSGGVSGGWILQYDAGIMGNFWKPVLATKSLVGLDNVDNTSDANKPVSTAQQTALDLKLAKASNLSDLANAGTARTNLGLGGAAILEVGAAAGTVAAGDHAHALDSLTDVTVVAPAVGHFLRHDGTDWKSRLIGLAHLVADVDAGAPADGQFLRYDGSIGVNKWKPVTPTRAHVGLGNVDNTADVDKPVSTAQAAALASKALYASVAAGTPFTRSDTTYANVTGMSKSVEAGKTYEVTVLGTYETDATTTGIGLRLSGTATLTAGRWISDIYGETSATTPNRLVITAFATNHLTTAVAAAATAYMFEMRGLVKVNAAGTFNLQCRSEVSASVVTIHPETYMVLREVS